MRLVLFTLLFLMGCGDDTEQICRDHTYMRLKCRTEMTGQYPLMPQDDIEDQCVLNYPEAGCYYE